MTLTSASRTVLLSAQKTESLLERSARRLATGLKVSSAVDDAVAFFQARALNERAADFVGIKDNISSGISVIKAAMDSLGGLESLLNQMKGIALGAKSEPVPNRRYDLYLQYDKLRDQIDAMAGDASFNGLNLIGNPANDLTVKLSPADSLSQSDLTVAGASMTSFSLGLDVTLLTIDNTIYASDPVKRQAFDDFVASMGRLTSNGTAVGAVPTDAGINFGVIGVESLDPFGSPIGAAGYLSLYMEPLYGYALLGNATADGSGHSAAAVQYQAVLAAQDNFQNGPGIGATITDVASGLTTSVFNATNNPSIQAFIWQNPWDALTDYADNIDVDVAAVDAAITTVRSTMSQLGSNTAMLRLRFEYTQNQVDAMTGGAAQLTNADLNEEGANLAALQTRQQLGMNSLRITSGSEKGILSLFR